MTNDLALGVGKAPEPLRPFPQPTPTSSSGPPPSRAGKTGVVVYLDPETARRLKVLAARRGTSMPALGAAALEALIADINNSMLECWHVQRS